MQRCIWRILALVLALGGMDSAAAQQANVGVPLQGASSGFNEQIGVRWGLRGNGWFFNFGGPPPAPPFGGFDPNTGAQFGFGGPNGFFELAAGQGATTSFSGQAPSVTVMNGHTGFFSDTIQRPFVTSVIPVVGQPIAPTLPPIAPGPSVLEERLERLQTEGSAAFVPPDAPRPVAPPATSTAERGDLSVAEIKAARGAEAAARSAASQAEIAGLLERAAAAEAGGKPSLARLYLQMAARKASGEQQVQILRDVARLSGK